MARMTNKQRVFVEEYLRCWNATEAALRAGYSERTAYSIGQENLKKPEIAELISERIRERAMSADEVLDRLAAQARATLADFVNFEAGIPIVDLRKANEAQRLGLIKKIKFFKEGGLEIELYDAQAALVHLGRYHALFTDRLKTEDWRTEIVELVRDGKLPYSVLAKELGDDLAEELFKAAGVPIASGVESAEGD